MSDQIGFFDENDDVFDLAAGNAAALEGMTRAAGANRVQPYRVRAAMWFDRVPRGVVITADDLVKAIGLPDAGINKNNSVGALFSGWSKKGLIENVGWSKTERVIGHARVVRAWRKR